MFVIEHIARSLKWRTLRRRKMCGRTILDMECPHTSMNTLPYGLCAIRNMDFMHGQCPRGHAYSILIHNWSHGGKRCGVLEMQQWIVDKVRKRLFLTGGVRCVC